jgi:hypothetical protein
MHLPADSASSDAGTAMNPIQAIGSATSYGKRYIAAALLNLTSRGADDDAVTAAAACDGTSRNGQVITAAQRNALLRLVRQVGADRRKFCQFFGIGKVGDLPAHALKRAENLLKAKGGIGISTGRVDKALGRAAA